MCVTAHLVGIRHKSRDFNMGIRFRATTRIMDPDHYTIVKLSAHLCVNIATPNSNACILCRVLCCLIVNPWVGLVIFSYLQDSRLYLAIHSVLMSLIRLKHHILVSLTELTLYYTYLCPIQNLSFAGVL